jgi:ribosomal protein S18 acetylase RimI-like enzyme
LTVRVEPLREITADDVRRLVVGYESSQRYDVHRVESADLTQFTLTLVDLDEPFVKRPTVWDTNIEDYRGFLDGELSFGAWDGDQLVGFAITEGRDWNKTAFVWQMRVEEQARGSGAGKRLLGAVEDAAKRAGFRSVECETQTTNVAAIAFYRACGYSMAGIDLAFYSNTDVENGEVAVFMKKAIA